MAQLSCSGACCHVFMDQLMLLTTKTDRVVLHRCKGKGGPNAFEQHMALRLAQVRPKATWL